MTPFSACRRLEDSISSSSARSGTEMDRAEETVFVSSPVGLKRSIQRAPLRLPPESGNRFNMPSPSIRPREYRPEAVRARLSGDGLNVSLPRLIVRGNNEAAEIVPDSTNTVGILGIRLRRGVGEGHRCSCWEADRWRLQDGAEQRLNFHTRRSDIGDSAGLRNAERLYRRGPLKIDRPARTDRLPRPHYQSVRWR